MKKNQHVVPHEKGWAVKGAGNEKNTKILPTQKEAINVAREIAKNQQSELVIHNKVSTQPSTSFTVKSTKLILQQKINLCQHHIPSTS
jgi:hypothetical protein